MGRNALKPTGAPAARGRRAAALSAIALACAGVISACGSSGGSSTTHKSAKYLDIARVERSIERSIMAQRHLKSKVVCPAKVPQKPGTFPCIATTISPKKPHKVIKTPFLVTVHNSNGYATYIGKKVVP